MTVEEMQKKIEELRKGRRDLTNEWRDKDAALAKSIQELSDCVALELCPIQAGDVLEEEYIYDSWRGKEERVRRWKVLEVKGGLDRYDREVPRFKIVVGIIKKDGKAGTQVKGFWGDGKWLLRKFKVVK